MPYNALALDRIFIARARKRVSKTDKRKEAYVLSRAQVEVLRRARLELSEEDPKPVTRVWLVGEATESVEASYYLSLRQRSGRKPEPRMGREFISSWLKAGDELTLATDGQSLFAYRGLSYDASQSEKVVSDTLSKVSTPRLRELSPKGYGPAPQRPVWRSEFIRSPAIVELVLRRANGACEFPGCSNSLFVGDSGSPYLEVHHIKFLSERGADCIENAAALCPSCHRAHHYAADRSVRTKTLSAAIVKRCE